MTQDQKQLAAQKIRTLLERRLASLLACEPTDLPKLKIGSLVHTLFLVVGADQTMPGFDSSFRALLDILGNDIVWMDVESKEEPAIVVN